MGQSRQTSGTVRETAGVSRRTALKSGAAGLTMGALGSRAAAAQDATPVAGATPAPEPTDAGFVGTWIVSVSFSGDTPLVLPNLVTYTSDGTVIVAAPPRLPELPGSGPEQDYFSAGHGVWVATGATTADLRFAFLVSDGDGNLASINTVLASVTLDPTGNAYSGAFSLDIVDASGATTGSSTGNLSATRITLDTIDPVTMPES